MSQSSEHLRARLIEHFCEVQETRMEGVPVLNGELEVDAFGFEPHCEFHVGVLLTPWFMNLVMMPLAENEELEGLRVGAKQSRVLPSGRFEFIAAHEEELGHYLTCSLFSPMFEFKDQDAAVETSMAVLEQVMTPIEEEEPDPDHDMQEIWAGRLPPVEEGIVEEAEEEMPTPPVEMSRRELFTGLRNTPSVEIELDGQTHDQ